MNPSSTGEQHENIDYRIYNRMVKVIAFISAGQGLGYLENQINQFKNKFDPESSTTGILDDKQLSLDIQPTSEADLKPKADWSGGGNTTDQSQPTQSIILQDGDAQTIPVDPEGLNSTALTNVPSDGN